MNIVETQESKAMILFYEYYVNVKDTEYLFAKVYKKVGKNSWVVKRGQHLMTFSRLLYAIQYIEELRPDARRKIF
jgi:hypothetical protein